MGFMVFNTREKKTKRQKTLNTAHMERRKKGLGKATDGSAAVGQCPTK
jgi:hypothetical protein